MSTNCDFAIVAVERDYVTIRDQNLGGKSVTNDAEFAVQALRREGMLKSGMKLFYFDSDNNLDEIVWEPGPISFRPGPGRTAP